LYFPPLQYFAIGNETLHVTIYVIAENVLQKITDFIIGDFCIDSFYIKQPYERNESVHAGLLLLCLFPEF